MADSASHQITGLLAKWSGGDETALEELIPLVYGELRRMAHGFMRRQPNMRSLQTTDLIHETYLKLANANEREMHDRAHFFGVAAMAMRHILVDEARSKLAQKRGGDRVHMTLDEGLVSVESESESVVALEDALKSLEVLDKRKGQVVELKFYGGLTNEETAEVLGVSVETVKRDWRFARSWLLRELDKTF